MKLRRAIALTAVTAVLAACGDDSPTEPTLTRAEVSGTYDLTVLSFDPQGSLPAVNLRERLVLQNPTLQLTSGGVAQLSYRDPQTNLLVTANGTYTTTTEFVRVDFGQSGEHRALLLSREMTFSFQTAGQTTLNFESDDAAVPRDRLLELAPEFAEEQLFDPVPGTLEATFRK